MIIIKTIEKSMQHLIQV